MLELTEDKLQPSTCMSLMGAKIIIVETWGGGGGHVWHGWRGMWLCIYYAWGGGHFKQGKRERALKLHKCSLKLPTRVVVV